MAATFRIRTYGVQAGFPRERAEARLMLLFRRPLEAVRAIADGNGALLKKGVDRATAERYRAALAGCGCMCEIEQELPPPPTRAALPEYADLLVEQLRLLDPGRRWQYIEADRELFGVPGPDSPYPLELVVPLERLHQEWLAAAPQAAADVLRHTAGMVLMGNTPGMAQEVERHLLPIVRNSAERGQAMLAAALGYSPLLYRPLCEGIEIGLAYHRGKVMHRVAQAHLEAWDMSEEQAFEAAYANLRERPLPPGYESSRILLTEAMQAAVTEGRPVAMIPTRGMLTVCSDQSDAALEAMLKAAIDAMREEKLVSPRMLRLVDGRWQNYVPPALARRLNSLAKYADGNDYRLQKELLKNRIAACGQDLYVASYMVGKMGRDQRRTSACTWTRGIPSLLPKTDMLCFADPAGDRPPITVTWEAALPVIGALMERTDDCPPRYLVQNFPNPMQLAQLADIAAAVRREERAEAAAAQAAAHAAAPPAAPRRAGWQALRSALGRWTDTKPAHAR